MRAFRVHLSFSPELIASDESRVEDLEQGLEIEATERHYTHALDRLSATCDGPEF